MNRYFISDKESDTLIALATKLYGLKIGELINIALKNEFLPVTEPFRTEAAFILQCNANGTLPTSSRNNALPGMLSPASLRLPLCRMSRNCSIVILPNVCSESHLLEPRINLPSMAKIGRAHV